MFYVFLLYIIDNLTLSCIYIYYQSYSYSFFIIIIKLKKLFYNVNIREIKMTQKMSNFDVQHQWRY